MKNKTVKSLIISEDLKKRAEEVARKKDLSLNAVIRIALSEYIERNK